MNRRLPVIIPAGARRPDEELFENEVADSMENADVINMNTIEITNLMTTL
jgi:hypothetical protein